MAAVPEFISVLRKIRDVIYPEISTLYEDSVELKQSIDVGKAEFDADFAQFNIDYEDFNESKTLVDAAVLSAQASAYSAIQSAQTATNKSNEIKAITAQSTTGAPGTSASASYNPTDGKFTFVIPQGSKGDKGESFTVNSSGTTAQRALYDAQPAGWSFLDITTSTLYFKASNTSGDWSGGVPFGKGDKGDIGDTGVGIVSFTFVSTTDISGLPAQSGATDTYRVTLTNTNTFDYQVYNGLDASLTYVDEQIDIVKGNIDTVSTQILAHIPLSGATAYNLLQGNLSVSDEVITKGFDTTLYTSGSATTGIDMSTQWGSTAEEKFGGLIWLKDRVEATSNFLYDTIRGATKEINSNTTDAEATLAGGLTAFNSTGFTVGADTGHNSTTNNMVSWNFQTTHRITGTTNHGKAYTCHYNPFTGFTIVKYEGSGIAGHEIPHHLGRKLGFRTIKNLSAINDWVSEYDDNGYLKLNLTDAYNATYKNMSNDNSYIINNTVSNWNASTNQYIMYGWANSYFDESDKLIGNYELVTYQGTGASGNKVKTKGKPAWVMVKRVDSTGNGVITDNKRLSPAGVLYPNLTTGETGDIANFVYLESDGLNIRAGNADTNASGGQYIALVAYDTNSNGGGSYYQLASDTANVQVNNALIPLAKGIDANGSKNSIVVANETITGLTYTEGKNYLYKTDTGYGVKAYEPRYLDSELVRRFAGEQPDYYDVESNKWFNCDAGAELVTNGKFSSGVTTGWTAQDGAILSIDNGTLKVLNGIATSGSVYQLISGLTIGKKYKIKARDVGGNTNYSSIYIAYGSPILANAVFLNGGSSGGTLATFTVDTTFIAQATSVYVVLRNEIVTINLYSNFDDISVFEYDIVIGVEITESRNYMNHIVYADNDGGVLYVEELPKIEYKDIIKANEFQGKNACTAFGSIDISTTPITSTGIHGIASIIRTSTGVARIYFNKPMNNLGYSFKGSAGFTAGEEGNIVCFTNKTLDYIDVIIGVPGTASGTALTPRNTKIDFEIIGGKN